MTHRIFQNRLIQLRASANNTAPLDSRIPIRKRKEHAPNDARFTAEKKLLADLADVAESEIAWIGLFRHVPVAGAASIEIDKRRGILSVFLKPDAIAETGAANPPVVDLAVGHNQLTGAIVQTVVS